MTLPPINRVERDGRYRLPLVTLADGRPAWERNRRVRQSDIDKHGSRALAHNRYWGAQTAAPYGEDRKLLDATVQAIQAATVKRDKRQELRDQLEARDGRACWICGQSMGRDWSVEHYVPRSAGGTDDLANLRLAHVDCNHKLGRLPVEAKEAVRAALGRAMVQICKEDL